MKNGLIVALQLVALSVAFWLGHHIAAASGEADLAKTKASWATERSQLASQRADAINARLIAEHAQAEAIHQAAESYEKGKADAEQAGKQVVADLRFGAVRLRDQWATCRATSQVLVATGIPKPDAAARDREESAGRIVRAAADADAQIRALQDTLKAERIP